MYEQHFGFSELPFTLTPNTHFYLNAACHRNALETVIVALDTMEGFIKIVGEVGTGKTLLCRRLLNELTAPYLTAYIPNPLLAPTDLWRALADELGIGCQGTQSKHEILKSINSRLTELAAEGRRVVLLIDEAQAMPTKTIEALRLLTNLETESSKLLQVVLFGQPELDKLLASEQLRQLRQRITFQDYLQPLDPPAVAHYIQHRIALAGYNGPDLFQRRALKLVAKSSQGIPRVINVVAHKALLSAFGEGVGAVEARHVRLAVKDTLAVSPFWGWLRSWA